MNSILALLMKRLNTFPVPLVAVPLLLRGWQWHAKGVAAAVLVAGVNDGPGEKASAGGGSAGDFDRASFLPSPGGRGGGEGERDTLRKDGIGDGMLPSHPLASYEWASARRIVDRLDRRLQLEGSPIEEARDAPHGPGLFDGVIKCMEGSSIDLGLHRPDRGPR